MSDHAPYGSKSNIPTNGPNPTLHNALSPTAMHSAPEARGPCHGAAEEAKELARPGCYAVVHEFELPNKPIECYSVTDIRKRGNGVNAERVLRPAVEESAHASTSHGQGGSSSQSLPAPPLPLTTVRPRPRRIRQAFVPPGLVTLDEKESGR